MPREPASSIPRTPLPSAFNLAALALFMMLAGLGAAYLIQAASGPEKLRAPSVFTQPLVQKDIAGTLLNVPSDWLFAPTQSEAQEVEFLDLRLFVPLLPQTPPAKVGLRLAAPHLTRPSAGLLDSVYALHFSPAQLSGPPGLIGKPLRKEDGFDNETVWYDPVSPAPFVAKCIDLAPSDDTPDCIRTVLLPSGLSVTYQFNSGLLDSWRTFDQTLAPYLEQIGAMAK